MNKPRVSATRRWTRIGIAFSSGLVLAAVIRYGILENEAQALMCSEANDSVLCTMRSAIGWSIHFQVFGLAALFLSMAAWLPALGRLATGALVLVGCGLVLYNTTYAAVATVVALLAALRPSSSESSAV